MQSRVCFSTKHRKSQTLPCALEATSRKCLISGKKIAGQANEKLINEDPLEQVKFVHLFKVTVLNLHVIMMTSETEMCM